MNPFDAIEKLITEHGSAAILRERLVQLKDQFALSEKRESEANIRTELAEARAKNLETQLAEARTEIQRLKQKQDDSQKLTADDIAVLRALSEARNRIKATVISQAVGFDGPKLDYVLGRLLRSEHIFSTAYTPSDWSIEQKGLDALFDPSA